jgi:isopentenyl diphosphate isomerase/L-lactate dehydrogenase-like FMN-dependent dehydrogenase
MSIRSIEDVWSVTTRPFWSQLYAMRDRDFIQNLIDRAKAAGCSALVLTLDPRILGQRHKDLRDGLSAPPKFTPKDVWQMAPGPVVPRQARHQALRRGRPVLRVSPFLLSRRGQAISTARKSSTLVRVGPVTIRSPRAAKRP